MSDVLVAGLLFGVASISGLGFTLVAVRRWGPGRNIQDDFEKADGRDR